MAGRDGVQMAWRQKDLSGTPDPGDGESPRPTGTESIPVWRLMCLKWEVVVVLDNLECGIKSLVFILE